MTPASRRLWVELTALGLFLISLPCFLLAGIATANFIIHKMLPNEPPLQSHGLILGWKELLVGALSMIVPGTVLVAAGWGLRSLLAEEDGPEE
jgi:hypothetical protein